MVERRNATVGLDADVSRYVRSLGQAGTATSAFVRTLDSSNDRMSMLVQSSLALGPALVPIGAAAVPALSGLASQLGLSAGAAGVAVLAFQGIGDALKATNDYAVEPSAANFDKMQQSLSELGPAGREFVGFLQEIRPELQGLQDAAQAGLLPGAEEGIRELMEVLPQAEQVVGTFATTIGTLMAEAGDNLNDPRWVEFFDFVENEAKTTLLDFGRSLGNLAEGFANLWMAFDPLSDDFSASFLQMSRDFATWSDGLAETQGFQDFVDYIRTNGPQAWETLGALGNALLEVFEAAAPIGAAALPVIEAFADGLAALADTPLGPTVIGILSLTSAYSRLVALSRTAGTSALGGLFGKTALGGGLSNIRAATAATKELRTAQATLATNPGMQGLKTYKENLQGVTTAEKNLTTATRARNRQIVAGGTGAAALGLMLTGVDQKLGLTNTATLALAGSLAGPLGTAVGAGVGLALDFSAANVTAAEALAKVQEGASNGSLSLEQQKTAIDATRDALEALAAAGFRDEDGEAALRETTAAYEESARAAQQLRFEEAGLGSAMAGTSESTRAQTDAILQNIAAHNELADQLLAAASGEIGFEQAIDDATASAAENGRTLDINTEAGRNNNLALIDLAGSWNKLTPAQQNAKGASERAREEFVNAATQMGATRRQAEALADKYLDIPGKVSTSVSLRDGASSKIGAISGGLAGLNGNRATVYINAIQTGVSIGGIGAQLSALNGRTANIRKKAGGGLLRGPGTGTSDSIPLLGSNGEYVVKAASVDKYGVALFEALNAGRFADGGQIGASKMQPVTAQQMRIPQQAADQSSQVTVNNTINPIPGMSDGQVAQMVSSKIAQALR